MSHEGSPLRWAILGLKHAGASRAHYRETEVEDVSQWLGREVDKGVVVALKKFRDAHDAPALAEAVSKLDTPRDKLGDVLEVADQRVKVLYNEGKRPSNFSHKYIPYIIEDVQPDGTVYMCKSVNGNKAMMAWDLNSNNTVVKVDEYEPLEVLGWEKLKDFPHGERQIREQYGDLLSDEVLEVVCGRKDTSSSGSSRRSGGVERLTISTGKKSHEKFNMDADTVREKFESQASIPEHSIARLVLFPPDTDRNLSDNWWITGDFTDTVEVAIANCKKSTYEKLSSVNQVWHVDEYIDEAGDYEVETSDGPMKLDDLDLDNTVVYTTSLEMYPEMTKPEIIRPLPEAIDAKLSDKWDEVRDIVAPIDTVVVLDSIRAFRAKPLLRDVDVCVYGDTLVPEIGEKYRVCPCHEYVLYARARLSDWNWESPELQAFENQCWNLEMDDGGFELVETLAMLHDDGKPVYSNAPKGRWDDA